MKSIDQNGVRRIIKASSYALLLVLGLTSRGFGQQSAVSIDISTNFIFDDVLTVRASYRSEDALMTIVKLEISENISMGYSYDHTLSHIGSYSDGSHEFMLGYRIPYTKKCHTYF